MKNEKLLEVIGLINDDFIIEATPGFKKEKSKIFLYFRRSIPISACAIFIICLTLYLQKLNNTPISNLILNENEATSYAPSAAKTNIIINEVDSLEVNKLLAMHYEESGNYISLDIEGLNNYYNMDIRPSYLPEAFNKEIIAGENYNNLGIYKNDDDKVYYDINNLKYESADKHLSLIVSMAKGYLRLPNVINTDALKISNINNHDFILFHYNDSEGNHYYSEFLYDGIGFNIWGNNISKEDFIRIISSYLDRDN